VNRLDAIGLREALGTDLAARLGAIETVSDIDSTNAELLRRGTNQPDNAVLIAEAQTAGRGRRGNVWHSPPAANLYLSLYRRIPGAPATLLGLSPAIGVACVEALQRLGQREVRLKWPNDLVARGHKLGGLLIETAGEAAVIGFGLNLRMPPGAGAAIDQDWIDLATLGAHASRETVVAAVLSHWLDALDQFVRAGFEPFRARWEALDAFAGRDVRLRSGASEWTGQACGIAADGGLRVRLPEGERVFHSADVSLRAA
jgi:BirA family biotin operon repressor/biotin-[acetyl-CoA-carboxylase] ligase